MPQGKGRMRKLLLDSALVLGSVALSCISIEAGYRAYLYYGYAYKADFPVFTVDVRPPEVNLTRPRNIFGPNPISTHYHMTYYNANNDVVYRSKGQTNNLGWTSRYDYTVEKDAGEFRIAVLGGSTTAAVTVERAWTDAAQEKLNSDPDLLSALGVKKFSVLNLGVLGAPISYMASITSNIASRFSPDLTVVNFSIESVTTENVSSPQLASRQFALPDKSELVADSSDAAGPPPQSPTDGVELVSGVEIPLLCFPPKSLSNPDCAVSNIWIVPPGRELSGAEIAEIKATVARRRLLQTVVLSSRPLALLEVLGKPVIPRARADVLDLNADQRAQFELSFRAFELLRQMHPHLLLTHNPHGWHAQPPASLLIDAFIGEAGRRGFDVARMSTHMPTEGGAEEAQSWYMFDGHWNDHGAQVYGEAIYRVIRQRLLAERGLAESRG